MKLRDLGILNKKGLDIFPIPRDQHGHEGCIVLRDWENPYDMMAHLVSSFECPQSLGILANGKDIDIFVIDDDIIQCLSLKDKSKLNEAMHHTIKGLDIHHIVAGRLKTIKGEQIIEIIED
jgi:hypothetical protein